MRVAGPATPSSSCSCALRRWRDDQQLPCLTAGAHRDPAVPAVARRAPREPRDLAGARLHPPGAVRLPRVLRVADAARRSTSASPTTTCSDRPSSSGSTTTCGWLRTPAFWNAHGGDGLSTSCSTSACRPCSRSGIAVLMHRLTQSIVVRGIVLMPYLVANVVVALVWFWMLDFQLGIVNQILAGSASARIAFFGDEAWAIPTIALRQRLAARRLHRAADLRRAADDPGDLYEAGRDGRRQRVADVPAASPCRCCGRSWRWCWSSPWSARSRCSTPSRSPPAAARSTPPG